MDNIGTALRSQSARGRHVAAAVARGTHTSDLIRMPRRAGAGAALLALLALAGAQQQAMAPPGALGRAPAPAAAARAQMPATVEPADDTPRREAFSALMQQAYESAREGQAERRAMESDTAASIIRDALADVVPAPRPNIESQLPVHGFFSPLDRRELPALVDEARPITAAHPPAYNPYRGPGAPS